MQAEGQPCSDCTAQESWGIYVGHLLTGSSTSFFQVLYAHGMFQPVGPIKRGFLIWTIKSCNLKACPRGLSSPMPLLGGEQKEEKRAAWWHSPRPPDQYGAFQKLLWRKRK